MGTTQQVDKIDSECGNWIGILPWMVFPIDCYYCCYLCHLCIKRPAILRCTFMPFASILGKTTYLHLNSTRLWNSLAVFSIDRYVEYSNGIIFVVEMDYTDNWLIILRDFGVFLTFVQFLVHGCIMIEPWAHYIITPKYLYKYSLMMWDILAVLQCVD